MLRKTRKEQLLELPDGHFTDADSMLNNARRLPKYGRYFFPVTILQARVLQAYMQLLS